MTEKRFTLDDEENGVCKCILVDGEEIPTCEVCNILNELYEENQQYKLLLQDMGLLMSDEDVMCIRSEIADKFIKPLCKENGFDVDVDCTNGFTIIPKGDVE